MNYFKNFDLDILTNVSQLIIKGNKERIKFLKSNKYDINNLIFNNVRHLYIENANIIFKNTFPKLERLILKMHLELLMKKEILIIIIYLYHFLQIPLLSFFLNL